MSTPISQAGQFKALVQWLGDAIRRDGAVTPDFRRAVEIQQLLAKIDPETASVPSAQVAGVAA